MTNFNTHSSYSFNENDFFTKTRTVYIMGEINAALAYDVTSRLKFLDFLDGESEITIEINSPGGEVSSGLAIIDTMNCIKSPVRTIVCGVAASMAAMIAACGTRGRRYILPHSTMMIHQPLGGFGVSQASDIEIYADNIIKTKRVLNELLASSCKKSLSDIERDTDRDFYLDASQALDYGIVDHVVESKKSV